jgi:short-subunit dehydrogenase
MLINNVGTALGGGFMTKSEIEYEDMIFMNVFPIVFFTKKLLPKLQ